MDNELELSIAAMSACRNPVDAYSLIPTFVKEEINPRLSAPMRWMGDNIAEWVNALGRSYDVEFDRNPIEIRGIAGGDVELPPDMD